MQLTTIGISGIAVPFYLAFGNPIPDNSPLYLDFLPESSISSGDIDTSSLFPSDSAAGALDFSDTTSLPLETDLLADPSDALPENVLDIGSADTPNYESLCGTDPGLQPYSKRDGDMCRPKPSVETPPFQLELPDLEKLEPRPGSNQVETPDQFNFQIYPIPGYTGLSDTDYLCPMPKRRLCCLGPLFGNVGNSWKVVNHCRDFGPWICPARYDVCCNGFQNYKPPGGWPLALGIMCSILAENTNGITWDLVGEAESAWNG